jgi:hypothetical protein
MITPGNWEGRRATQQLVSQPVSWLRCKREEAGLGCRLVVAAEPIEALVGNGDATQGRLDGAKGVVFGGHRHLAQQVEKG